MTMDGKEKRSFEAEKNQENACKFIVSLLRDGNLEEIFFYHKEAKFFLAPEIEFEIIKMTVMQEQLYDYLYDVKNILIRIDYRQGREELRQHFLAEANRLFANYLSWISSQDNFIEDYEKELIAVLSLVDIETARAFIQLYKIDHDNCEDMHKNIYEFDEEIYTANDELIFGLVRGGDLRDLYVTVLGDNLYTDLSLECLAHYIMNNDRLLRVHFHSSGAVYLDYTTEEEWQALDEEYAGDIEPEEEE